MAAKYKKNKEMLQTKARKTYKNLPDEEDRKSQYAHKG